MGFTSCIHESGHCVVGTALGFSLDRVEVSDVHARTLWNLGPRRENTHESTVTGESRSAVIEAVRGDARTLELFVAGLRAAVGGSDEHLLDYLTMSMAGRIAHGRVAPGQDALEGGASDIAVEDLLLVSLGRDRLQSFAWRAARIATNLVEEH